tara:strand:- start:1763 stop:2362 length:600 start_codon:yes stop_codon:yes gene_type:complete
MTNEPLTTTFPDQSEMFTFPYRTESGWESATIFYFTDDTYTLYQNDSHYTLEQWEVDEYWSESEQRIKEYDEFIFETGTDPLNNYLCVDHTETKSSVAFVEFGRYIGCDKKGFSVLSVEWEGKKYENLTKLPSHVYDYLYLKRDGARYIMEGITSVEMLEQECTDITNNSFKCVIEYEVDRPSDVIASELRAIVKKSLL